MAAIDSAYNYYLTTYGDRASTHYDTHKKSELRKVYNRMVKVNKESPLYKIKNDGNVKKFAIDIKEGAQNVRNVVASLSGSDDIMKAFQKKIAVSSQENVVKARYVGRNNDESSVSDFEIEVKQLAKPQVNIGNFLKRNKLDLKPDEYSFDLTNTSTSYEFQFNVNEEDTNFSIQTKLANLISNANIGLKASVIEDEKGMSALRIESLITGLSDQEEFLFKISAGGSTNSVTGLQVLGIEQVSQEAQNASFLLNGDPRTSYTNNFIINRAFELTLIGISPEDEPAVIGFKANADAITDNIQSLVDSYNSILHMAAKYADSQQQSHKLIYQMGSAARNYRFGLESIGLKPDENGLISVDKALLTDVINSENPKESFMVLNDFKNALDAKAADAVVNPMAYVNKVIVAYKNPGNNFVSPYISSIYSGMMMDRYC